MKEKYLFSVVMPIYGAEKYLASAIDSVLNQTYKNFEIILVDDCSPDECPRICDSYAQEYENIAVIHHEQNLGLSGARNSGLEVAKGDYIFFMDSDDTVEDYLFERVVESLDQNEAQVVVFGLIEDYYDEQDALNKSVLVSFGADEFISNASDVRKEVILLEQKTLYGYAWNKFYNLNYLKSINAKFEDVTLIEDITFNVAVFQNVELLNILDVTPYHYMRRMEGSLTHRFIKDYYGLQRRRIELVINQYKAWGCFSENIKSIIATIYVRYIFSALERNCDKRSNMTLLRRIKWIKNLFNDSLFVELIEYANSDSIVVKLMAFFLKKRKGLICLLVGRFIYLVKNKFPAVFTRIKQNR